MSYREHIPVDDIPDSDLEADLMELSRLTSRAGPGKSRDPEEKAISSDSDFRLPNSQGSGDVSGLRTPPAVPFTGGGMAGGEGGWDGGGSSGGGEGGAGVRGDALAVRDDPDDVTDLDLAMARKRVEENTQMLMKDGMRDTSWGRDGAGGAYVSDGGDRQGARTVLDGAGAVHTDAGDDVSQKRKFINSLRREHQERLLAETKGTPPPEVKVLKDLVPDTNNQDGPDDSSLSRPSAEDIADFATLNKYKHAHIKTQTTEDGEEDSRPFQGAGGRRTNETVVDNETDEEEEVARTATDTSTTPRPRASHRHKYDRRKQLTVKANLKHRRKHKKHKPTQGHVHSLESEIHNEAVAKMADVAAQTHRNQSAIFDIADKGRDRVDLPVSDSAGAWTTKVHGHRDMVIAGSIVMCLGAIIIFASLIALVRQRFITSMRKRSNTNNNKRYRRLGSASETEILRQPHRSLLPSESSDEESSSSADTDFQEKDVYENF